jgi:hypothetical protein
MEVENTTTRTAVPKMIVPISHAKRWGEMYSVFSTLSTVAALRPVLPRRFQRTKYHRTVHTPATPPTTIPTKAPKAIFNGRFGLIGRSGGSARERIFTIGEAVETSAPDATFHKRPGDALKTAYDSAMLLAISAASAGDWL